MSGPKVSAYELTATQRKKFYEQLEILKQTEVNLQLVFMGMTNLHTEISKLNESIEKGKDLAKQTARGCDFSFITGQMEEIFKTIESCEKEYLRIKEEYHVDKAGYVKMSAEMNEQRAAKLMALQALNSNISDQIKHVKKLQKEALEEIENIDEALKEELQEQILGGFSVSFSNIQRELAIDEAEDPEGENAKDIEKRNIELEKFRKFQDRTFEVLLEISEKIGSIDRLSPVLQKKFAAIRDKAAEIASVDFMENFLAISVTPFSEECNEYIALLKEFDEVRGRYEYLCQETGKTVKRYAVTKDNISLMMAEIAQMDEIDEDAKSREFIENAIDEAMTEMGYDLVGHREIVKRNGKRVRHELYHFSEGTGVDVTFSGDGQITMELGGFDNKDRTPDESESDRLVGDMEKFCNEYAALERVLERKGVKRRNVRVFPASIEYAQILNTEDYEMTKPVQRLEVKKSQKASMQKRGAE